MSTKKFLDVIQKQRSKRKKTKFQGTFLEYLQKVQKDQKEQ